MKKKITTVEDYMIGKAELELERARDVYTLAEHEADYFKEKISAKLVAFHEAELALIRLYVEARLYYPDLARALEERKPWLESLYAQAFEEWSQP